MQNNMFVVKTIRNSCKIIDMLKNNLQNSVQNKLNTLYTKLFVTTKRKINTKCFYLVYLKYNFLRV